jgi:membrane fusion protein, macrolide-specific efflux system
VNPTPEVVNNVVLYNALFDVPNPDAALMTQMTAQVFFVAGEAKDATFVPAAALHRRQGKTLVRVQTGDGKLETREVELGLVTRVSAEVRSGLQPGERVATSAPQQPRGARAASNAPTPKMGPRL